VPDQPPPGPQGPYRFGSLQLNRRRIGAGAGLAIAGAVVVVVVVSAGPSPSRGASTPKARGAATVARRNLVATDTESGTIGYANPQTVFNRLSGTITQLPTVGQVIEPGHTLYRVSGQPVVLFDGTIPAYRNFTAGMSDGADVKELKADLKAMGFDPGHQITVSDTFDSATTGAIDRWQSSLGETQTGTITLGQIVILPGPQRITQVDSVLGSTGGGSGSGAGSNASTFLRPHPEFVDLTTTTTTPATTTTLDTSATPDTTTTHDTTTTPSSCPTSSTQTPATTTTTTTPATTPTCPTSGSAGTPSTSTRSPSNSTPSSSGGPQAETLAALLALLRAETSELKRTSAKSGGAGRGSSNAGTSGGSGARNGAASLRGGSSGGSGGSGAGGGSGGSGSGSGAGSGSGSGARSGSGSGGGTAQAILQTTSTRLQVTVPLDATKQSEAVVGEPVTVQLPSGDTVDGKITKVSPVAQSSSGSGSGSGGSGGGGSGGNGGSGNSSSTVPITISLSHVPRQAGLDQAAVSVNFEQQVEDNVLSVPVTALLATNGGGYAVQEANPPHRLLPVTPGLFAAGYVQVSGGDVYPGLQVTDSQG
jgi:Putative peptidoglycan binding domain